MYEHGWMAAVPNRFGPQKAPDKPPDRSREAPGALRSERRRLAGTGPLPWATDPAGVSRGAESAPSSGFSLGVLPFAAA